MIGRGHWCGQHAGAQDGAARADKTGHDPSRGYAAKRTVHLVPFSKQYLRLNEALPFGLRDADGRLLLAAGQRVDRPDVLRDLHASDLFADESESSQWRRRLGGAIDAMLLSNAPLGRIAERATQPERGRRANERGVRSVVRLSEQWDDLVATLDALLRDPSSERDWPARLRSLAERVRVLGDRRTDESLYHLIYAAGHTTAHYSAHHGLLCMLVVRETSRLLAWESGLRRNPGARCADHEPVDPPAAGHAGGACADNECGDTFRAGPAPGG